MKFIKKDIKREPASLRNYRNTTPNATYEGYPQKDDLRKILVEEQGSICAYCMGRISAVDLNEQYKPTAEIEHFHPRESYPAEQLDYNNMLAVCNGLSISHPDQERFHHCDKAPGLNGKINGKVVLRKLDPRKRDCESLIRYTALGEILPAIDKDDDVRHDLEEVLNLNNKVLVERRKNALDIAKKKLEEEKPTSTWDRKLLERHREEWMSRNSNEYRRYCVFVAYILGELAKKPKYNT